MINYERPIFNRDNISKFDCSRNALIAYDAKNLRNPIVRMETHRRAVLEHLNRIGFIFFSLLLRVCRRERDQQQKGCNCNKYSYFQGRESS
jgi:hypothetical protein